jgi:hypothetical protein
MLLVLEKWPCYGQGEQGDRQRSDGASPVRRDRASPVKQGERQEYIDVLSLHRQSLQNKQRSQPICIPVCCAKHLAISSLFADPRYF